MQAQPDAELCDASDTEDLKESEEVVAVARDILGAEAMITTENMPGSAGIVLVERVASVSAPAPTHTYYRYDELGPKTRRIRLPRVQLGTSEHIITFEAHKSYVAVFDGAIAYVPQVIADFVQRENPGQMRLD